MARVLRHLALLGVIALASFSQAAGVLVVQYSPESAEDPDPEKNLALYFAGKMDEDGRLKPIAWSVADVIFRTATEDGLIKPTQKPTPAEIQAIATKLRCEYVMEVGLWRREGIGLLARARLLKDGKEVWRDPLPGTQNPIPPGQEAVDPLDKEAKHVNVEIGGAQNLNSVWQTLAQTWLDQLTLGGPLKDLPARPKITTPQAEPGTQPRPMDPTPPPKVDNTQLFLEAQKKLAAGDRVGAIALLRDGVDATPFDLGRRKALIDALILCDLPEDAARTARLAADAIPDGAALWAMAARAWIAAGKDDEAQKDLKEAVARDPENGETRILMAELSLTKGQLSEALTHAEAAIAKSDSADGRLVLAMAKILSGQPAEEDLAKAKELGAFEGAIRQEKAYRLALRCLNGNLGDLGEATRALMTEARRDRQTPSVEKWRAEIVQKADRGIALLNALPAPAAHTGSDGERRLALKMLAQAMSELSGWIKSADEDLLADATISLGEALRGWREAELKFADEKEAEQNGDGDDGDGDGRRGPNGLRPRYAGHPS